MTIREVLAMNPKALRKARAMSQEDLAHGAKIDRTYISALERCVYAASIDVVERLAGVLGVAAADLLTRPSQPDKPGQPVRPASGDESC
jgi:transcriptional regulator with XRE-family HTH domain